jgi:Flp pilus assembly protein TadB
MTPLQVALVGLAVCGLYLALSALPFFQARPMLEERLRRFDVEARLRGQRPEVGQLRRPLLPGLQLDAALRPLLEDLVAPLQHVLLRDGVFGGSVERQLRVVHPGMSRQAFVARQLLWGAGALALFLVVFASREQLDAAHVLVSLLAGGVGFVVPWLLLRQAARARKRRLLAELPHVARLLALGMSASLPLDVALEHVGERSHGPLGQLIGRAHRLAADRTAEGLMPELARQAALEDVPELSSFVAMLKASDAQGLPLARGLETLASTLEQRSATRLLAAAERGTIKMLFPLALVLTPVIVVVSLVPALLALYALVRGG